MIMNDKWDRRSGYTLIELLVVILIIGILAAVAIPNYVKSLETSKADDAVAIVNMIGTTNKMYALDHGGNYIVGTFPSSANMGCGTATNCQGTVYVNACNLVWCKYLADQNWGAKPYTFYACDPAGGACGASGGSGKAAGAKRKSGTYSTWGYSQDATGVITNHNGAPTPTY